MSAAMLPLLIIAQIAAAAPGIQSDSNYSSAALRSLVAAASAANHLPPPGLRGYTSRIETESSLLIRDTIGRENSAEIEQMETAARWRRGGTYDLHVVGYRSQV
jgi:hypothetical protein